MTALLAATAAAHVRTYLRLEEARARAPLGPEDQAQWDALPRWLLAGLLQDALDEKRAHLQALVDAVSLPLPLPPRDITDRQRDVLRAIASYTASVGASPSYRQLASILGVSSTHTISGHVDALIARGCIRRADGHRRRGLVLLVDPK